MNLFETLCLFKTQRTVLPYKFSQKYQIMHHPGLCFTSGQRPKQIPLDVKPETIKFLPQRRGVTEFEDQLKFTSLPPCGLFIPRDDISAPHASAHLPYKTTHL